MHPVRTRHRALVLRLALRKVRGWKAQHQRRGLFRLLRRFRANALREHSCRLDVSSVQCVRPNLLAVMQGLPNSRSVHIRRRVWPGLGSNGRHIFGLVIRGHRCHTGMLRLWRRAAYPGAVRLLELLVSGTFDGEPGWYHVRQLSSWFSADTVQRGLYGVSAWTCQPGRGGVHRVLARHSSDIEPQLLRGVWCRSFLSRRRRVPFV